MRSERKLDARIPPASLQGSISFGMKPSLRWHARTTSHHRAMSVCPLVASFSCSIVLRVLSRWSTETLPRFLSRRRATYALSQAAKCAAHPHTTALATFFSATLPYRCAVAAATIHLSATIRCHHHKSPPSPTQPSPFVTSNAIPPPPSPEPKPPPPPTLSPLEPSPFPSSTMLRSPATSASASPFPAPDAHAMHRHSGESRCRPRKGRS